jgi:multiple antibiotic resistance protein
MVQQDPSYVFIIFFLTLGPIKTIPAFFRLTMAATPKFRMQAALQAALIATGVCLFIGFVGVNVLGKWKVSLDALRIAGGLILLLSALKVVTMQPQPSGGTKVTAETPLSATQTLAFSPLTTPVIITPYGVVAILFYMVVSKGDTAYQAQIIGMIFLMMFLNYLGMIFADKIMKTVGFPILRLIGWIFAVMQSALAIDIILRAFMSLGVIKQIS